MSLEMERGIWKPNVEISPNCPRCGSSNTKFCYYNNYSLTQPRYFCKGCRRYWTKGGSLRNVPVGGGCRKSRSRGKSLRLETDDKSRGFGYSDRSRIGCNGFRSVEHCSSSSTVVPDGSQIDLALVYANYLNQQQDPKTNSSIELPELPIEFDPSCLDQFPAILSTNLDSEIQLAAAENAIVDSLSVPDLSIDVPLNEAGHLIYQCEPDSLQKNQEIIGQQCPVDYSTICNSGLPPLPGELDASHHQDMLLPNPHIIDTPVVSMPQHSVLGPEIEDPNLLFGDWSSFDLSSDNSFPGT